jgi:hypothetical protein
MRAVQSWSPFSDLERFRRDFLRDFDEMFGRWTSA